MFFICVGPAFSTNRYDWSLKHVGNVSSIFILTPNANALQLNCRTDRRIRRVLKKMKLRGVSESRDLEGNASDQLTIAKIATDKSRTSHTNVITILNFLCIFLSFFNSRRQSCTVILPAAVGFTSIAVSLHKSSYSRKSQYSTQKRLNVYLLRILRVEANILHQKILEYETKCANLAKENTKLCNRHTDDLAKLKKAKNRQIAEIRTDCSTCMTRMKATLKAMAERQRKQQVQYNKRLEECKVESLRLRNRRQRMARK